MRSTGSTVSTYGIYERTSMMMLTGVCVALLAMVSATRGLRTIVQQGEFNVTYDRTVNDQVEYIMQFQKDKFSGPARVTIASGQASRQFPVLVVARQQKEVISWQVPLLVDTKTGDIAFHVTSRTLCPDNIDVLAEKYTAADAFTGVSSLIVSVSTSSPNNVSLTLSVENVTDFRIVRDVQYEVTVSPSEPRYFLYKFEGNASDATRTALLRVDSDDDVCMVVSVQNSSCPMYDLEHDVRFEGFWQTVNRRGGITLSQAKFPYGFFVVLVPKSEDSDCTGVEGGKPGSAATRSKRVRFIIQPSISYDEYAVAVGATLAGVLLVWAMSCTLTCCCGARCRSDEMGTASAVEADGIDEVDGAVATPSTCAPSDWPGAGDGDDNDDCSMDETEYDTVTEVESVRRIFSIKGALHVSDLARKDGRILQKKSYLYLWHVLTVAVFYGLPVVQLVVTYQRVLRATGNQDLCYYNFLCAHPLGLLSDLNHVLSNVGYVALGGLFLALTRRRELAAATEAATGARAPRGIPHHHGLFYAMGAALMMEGVLSASYHVCPNHSNFQFDSSFMYVMAVLCMVKIYQNRHPDINATAYATFGALAALIAAGMVGILDGTVYFWAAFTAAHLLACLLLTAQVYHMGCWSLDRGTPGRALRALLADPGSVLRPAYPARMLLLLAGNACNWALAVAGLLHHDRDFATYLLAVLMSNLLLYTLFYVTMKLCHGERIGWHAGLYIALGTLCWTAALYFFLRRTISWALTPAESRHFNRDCVLLRFYDTHDVWHFLSAAAMFFSFMVLLTLDDDLADTPRTRIPVF